jgi:hypothetical protein
MTTAPIFLVGWREGFFPASFPFAEEAARAGVKAIRFGLDSKGAGGSYNPFTEEIQIDPGTDWEKYAATVNARFPGLDVTPEDAIVFLFFHELGHASRREHYLKLRTGRLDHLGTPGFSLDILVAMRESPEYLAGQLPFVDEWIQILAGEKAANAYAAERFRKWKRGGE